MSQPHINVTPLIDVLLVLLIIFMVITPLKPSTFKAKLPAEPRNENQIATDPETLVVIVGEDSSLKLNNESGLGHAEDAELLTARLQGVFQQRIENGAVSPNVSNDNGRPFPDRIQRTVFIKAPKSIDYGSVARVVDAVKLAGAYPIALQIDALE
jgi:biopolymer transport protein ExbD